MKRKILVIGALAALLASAYFGTHKPRKPIDVPMSHTRHSQGEILSSKGFGGCSAVILDYDGKAVMAHVPLPFDQAYLRIGLHNELHTENVVEYLSNQMEKREIDPRECVAFVNAGCKRGLDRIVQDLVKKDIKIEEANLDDKSRDIQYNPRTNSLIVIYN